MTERALVQLPPPNSLVSRMFPAKKRCWVSYVACYQIALGTTGSASVAQFSTGYVIVANSAYDPVYSATGTFNESVQFYKYFAQFYNRYNVLKSNVVMNIRQATTYTLGTALADEWVIGLKRDATPSISAAPWEVLQSDPRCHQALFTPTIDGKATLTLKHDFVAKRDLASTDVLAGVGANMGSNPTQVFYWIPYYQHFTKLTAPTAPAINVSYSVRMLVEFSDVRDMITTTDVPQQ